MAKVNELEEVFYPKSVAIIGASVESSPFFLSMSKGKLKENVYLVNLKYKELLGIECYRSILDIPHSIDYAIIAVPAKVVPDAIKECIKKGVKTAHIFSSGFSETGEKQRVESEKELTKIVKGKIKVIGPNCMGVYCPDSGLYFVEEQPNESGPVGFVSQSGTFAVDLSTTGKSRNIRFSKVVSYGNAIDLNSSDFIAYLGEDPKTKVIVTYIEGVKNGRKFFNVLKKVAKKKPVIALKGGRTKEGARAASSHTGSLAGSKEIWEALFKQTGAIQVKSFEELEDTTLAFLNSPFPKGRGTSIMSVSGGLSVVDTDSCVEVGLEIPQFSDDTIKRLKKIVPIAGTSVRNPLDAWPAFVYGTLPEVIDIIASDEKINSIILEMRMIRFSPTAPFATLEDFLKAVAKECNRIRDQLKKPTMISISPYTPQEIAHKCQMIFQNADLPVYSSIERAAKAIFNLYTYHRHHRRYDHSNRNS
ncbi:MAG: acetate--CoA ligase family protein [Candidatus Hodarchaeota archaeon]